MMIVGLPWFMIAATTVQWLLEGEKETNKKENK